MKQKCNSEQAVCMAMGTEAEKKSCWEGKMKVLKEKLKKLDPATFCDKAPANMKQMCNSEKAKCMAKTTEAEKKSCWEAKVKALGEKLAKSISKIAEKGT